MDKIGVQRIIQIGVDEIRREWAETGEASPVDSLRVSTVLDRFAELGLVLLEHGITELFDNLVQGLVEVYRNAVPAEDRGGWPTETQARFASTTINRALLLGAFAHQKGRYDEIRLISLQEPRGPGRGHLWVRHAVTMVARRRIPELFGGKSLIGPASEYVRERKSFFGRFDNNLDHVVNHLCQFDFLGCVAILHAQNDTSRCYPNFGGFFPERTIPAVHALIDGAARDVAPGISDPELAEILVELDGYAGEAFLMVSAWEHLYGRDTKIQDFILANT